MNRRLEPVVYSHLETGRRHHLSAYARMVECLASFTDVEPDETFTDADVLAAGEELCRAFQARVREAAGDESWR